MKQARRFLVVVSLLLLTCPLRADEAPRFTEDVQPLLEAKCVSCHGPEKQEGGLRLDSLAMAKEGGDSGPAIVPGDVTKSLLAKAITFRDPNLQMPPKQKLTDKEIATLTEWVKAGAAWPEAGAPSSTNDSSPMGDAFTDKRNPIRKLFRGERLDLWSLTKPRSHARQSVGDSPSTGPRTNDPRSGERGDGSHIIDTFIRERLTKAGLKPSPEADRRTLIRRLTFDLTGLPPTTDDVQAFVADKSPDAYDKLVNRLLDSPRYGERQARLWLDVVRYADTNGYERDEFRPLAWQYRDYVIRSFNQDKPFDQFIREQLAGDELLAKYCCRSRHADRDRLLAAGSVGQHGVDFSGRSPSSRRDDGRPDEHNRVGVSRTDDVLLSVSRPQVRSVLASRPLSTASLLRRRDPAR